MALCERGYVSGKYNKKSNGRLYAILLSFKEPHYVKIGK